MDGRVARQPADFVRQLADHDTGTWYVLGHGRSDVIVVHDVNRQPASEERRGVPVALPERERGRIEHAIRHCRREECPLRLEAHLGREPPQSAGFEQDDDEHQRINMGDVSNPEENGPQKTAQDTHHRQHEEDHGATRCVLRRQFLPRAWPIGERNDLDASVAV